MRYGASVKKHYFKQESKPIKVTPVAKPVEKVVVAPVEKVITTEKLPDGLEIKK